MAVFKRLTKELKDLQKKPIQNISVGPIDENDLLKWQATIIGPEGTPYYNGKYKLSIEFPQDYPFKPPKIQFITKIYACNVNERGGNMSLWMLKRDWAPHITISKALTAIIDAVFFKAGAFDKGLTLQPQLYRIYSKDRESFTKTALEWNDKYANSSINYKNYYIFPQKSMKEYGRFRTNIYQYYYRKYEIGMDVFEIVINYYGNENNYCDLYEFINSKNEGDDGLEEKNKIIINETNLTSHWHSLKPSLIPLPRDSYQ